MIFFNYILKIVKLFSSKVSGMISNGSLFWKTVRFNLFFTMIISNVSIFGIWIALCIIKSEILSIPESVVLLYATANGIALTGKTAEKIQETKQNITNITDQSVTNDQNTDKNDSKQVL